MKLRKYIVLLITILGVGTVIQGMESMALNELSRGEAATKIVETLGYTGVAKMYDKKSSSFQDVSVHKGNIELVSEWGFMNGIGSNIFGPTQKVTSEQSNRVNERMQTVLKEEIAWKHGFYAISSSSQMELIPLLDAVSFGWAQLEYNSNKGFWINTGADNANDFKIPTGFHKPMDFAKTNGVEIYLMVYFEDKNGLGAKLLSDSKAVDRIIIELVELSKGITKDGITRGFDGLTIDFENFKDENLQQSYNSFLIKLDKALHVEGKKLNVAVQPAMYFKGYDYKTIGEIADKVIVMAHDYAPKKMSEFEKGIGQVYTPVTPIDQVYRDLKVVVDETTGIKDKSKVVLQISFGSVQWQVAQGKVLNDYAYTPSYDKIHTRLQLPGTQVVYDKHSGNPYANYIENGMTNTIWYEDIQSVMLKENLVRLLDLGGVSYWRLGNIPQDIMIGSNY